DQENHRPGGSQPEILLLITAERLHLIDVGRLECEHGKRGNAKNCPDIAPFEAFDGNEIANVADQTGCDDEQEFGYAHDPGHHNRGPGSSQRRSGRTSRTVAGATGSFSVATFPSTKVGAAADCESTNLRVRRS